MKAELRLTLLCALFLGACTPKSKIVETPSGIPVEVNQEYSYEEKDDFKALSGKIDGDILTLVVQYSGGCKEHVFSAHTNGMLMKSLPPKMGVYIEHNGNQDLCKSLVVDTVLIDLTPIKKIGENPSNKLILNIEKIKIPMIYEL